MSDVSAQSTHILDGMRLSVLDRANATSTATGTATISSTADVLQGVLDHARHVEALGFAGFFVAEHHGVPGIPGTQPAMLATAVGAATSRIRVGTAGIMLPAHQPLIVAEQITTLEALYPGRVDAGIGSSVGFTAAVRASLRQGDAAELKARYPEDLREMLGHLATDTPVWLLAGFRSVLLAADLGLGVILGGPNQADAADLYRRNFRPGRIDAPQVIHSLNVAVADTTDAARDLLLPEAFAQAHARTTGVFEALRPVDELPTPTEKERRRMAETLAMAVWGTPRDVEKHLRGLGDVLVTGGMSNLAGRARSEELLAELA